MKKIIGLADPHADPLKVSADGGLDVVTRVTHAQMEWGWSQLRQIMKNEPSARMREWSEDGRSEDQLRLLCGLFVAVAQDIPMVSSNFIEWLRLLDGDSLYGDVVWRMKQLGDEEFEYVLDGRDLDGLGLERVGQSVSRGPASVSAVARAIATMSLEEVVQLDAVLIDRVDQLRSRPHDN